MADSSNWGTIQTGSYGDKVRMDDIIEFIDKLNIKKFSSFRFIGNVAIYKQYWLPVYKDAKPIAGKSGRNLQIPKLVTNFDGKTQTYDEANPCPYAQLAEKMNKYLGDKEKSYESVVVIANCIDRELQENLPAKIVPPSKEELKSGFRNIDSKHKNPVKAFAFTGNEFSKIKGTMELNLVKLKSGEKVQKAPSDVKYGYDINLKWKPDEKVASDKLKIQKGERTPLTEEEQAYLVWDLEAAIASQIEKKKDAQKECDRLWAEFEKYLKKNGKLKSKSSDEDEGEDEPEDLEDDEEVKPKKKKKVIEEEEEEDDDEVKPKKKKKIVDYDEDEEEEKPKKKKKKIIEEDEKPVKNNKKSSKKKVEDDDDDEDEIDDLDLDDSDDDD